MESKKAQQFLASLVDLLKVDAFEAKKDYLAASDDDTKLFNDGVLMGYYYVINLLKQQAEAFGYELSDINLDDFDPDKDLLS
jgi:hypothetical protein